MIDREAENKKQGLGVWDISKKSIGLGTLLILLEELQIQSINNAIECFDLCFVGNPKDFGILEGIRNYKPMDLIDKGDLKSSFLLSALFNIKGLENIFWAESILKLKKYAEAHYLVTWPEFQGDKLKHRNYESMLAVQSFYDSNKAIPYLSCKYKPLLWAVDFIENNLKGHLPVVVHLKNNPFAKSESNANFDIWSEFFEICYGEYDVKFILIGNEEIPDKICQFENVILSKDYDGNLSRDLALIQIAFIFMGMSSGPCNMAIFNDVPYVIFKNPDHHAEEMKKELGEHDRFLFAKPFQTILRQFETRDLLVSNFENIYSNLDKNAWKKKIETLIKENVT